MPSEYERGVRDGLAQDERAYRKGYEEGLRARLKFSHWVWDPDTSSLSCSGCGNTVYFEDADTALAFLDGVNYCMHCGAKMEETIWEKV